MSRDSNTHTVSIVAVPTGYGKFGQLATAMPNRSWVTFDGSTQYGVVCNLPAGWEANFVTPWRTSSAWVWGNRLAWNPIAKAVEGQAEGDHATVPGYIWYNLVPHDTGQNVCARPLGSHMQDRWTCNPNTGDIYFSQYDSLNVRRFRHGDATYPVITTTPHNRNIHGATEWFTGALSGVGAQGALVVMSNYGWVDIYDPLAASWSSITVPGISEPDSYNHLGAYSAVKNCFVFGGGHNAGGGPGWNKQLWRMDSNRTVTKYAAQCPASITCDIYDSNFIADPITGKFIVYYGPSRELWEFDPDGTGIWTQLGGTSTPPASFVKEGALGSVRNTGAVSITELGVVAFFMQGGTRSGLFLYKHG